MTIRNIKKFIESLWDWGCLDGCFGSTKIKPTDIDGLVERNGKFLVIETKLPDNDIPTGQMITFNHMISTGVFTIYVVWGHPGQPERILKMTRNGTQEYENADLSDFRELVGSWFEWASDQTPEPRFDS